MNYINIDAMADSIERIYKEQLDCFSNDERRYLEENGYDEESIRERAVMLAYEFNENMRDYLHQKDHKICGNFNNVEYDYPHFRTGEFEENAEMLDGMIDRLDRGEESEQATADRQFLTDWFWDTFGTFGVGYNFMDELCEQIYIYDKEMEIEPA